MSTTGETKWKFISMSTAVTGLIVIILPFAVWQYDVGYKVRAQYDALDPLVIAGGLALTV